MSYCCRLSTFKGVQSILGPDNIAVKFNPFFCSIVLHIGDGHNTMILNLFCTIYRQAYYEGGNYIGNFLSYNGFMMALTWTSIIKMLEVLVFPDSY